MHAVPLVVSFACSIHLPTTDHGCMEEGCAWKCWNFRVWCLHLVLDMFAIGAGLLSSIHPIEYRGCYQ